MKNSPGRQTWVQLSQHKHHASVGICLKFSGMASEGLPFDLKLRLGYMHPTGSAPYFRGAPPATEVGITDRQEGTRPGHRRASSPLPTQMSNVG